MSKELIAAAEALQNGEQCDADGVMVKVSREAAHMGASALMALSKATVTTQAAQESAQDAADRVAGWKMVPVEPTEEMLKRGFEAFTMKTEK